MNRQLKINRNVFAESASLHWIDLTESDCIEDCGIIADLPVIY